jgi:FMN reductase
MTEETLKVMCVIGSSAASSATHAVIDYLRRGLVALGDNVDVFDPVKEPLALFNPTSSFSAPDFPGLKRRVDQTDVFIFATPDYHGSVSSTLKNFLDHFWNEFAGKLFAQVVCSHEKGLTVIDQLRTVARQCYAWSMPYGVSFGPTDLAEGLIVTESVARRLEMLVHDIHVYGAVLRRQREIDLAGSAPTFLASSRDQKSQRVLGQQ